MQVATILQRGINHLGHTFQEVKDIGENTRVFYRHRQWDIKKPLDVSSGELVKLQIPNQLTRSRLFIFENYTFLIDSKEAGSVHRLKLVPIKERSLTLGQKLFLGSLWRVAKGVATVVLAILSSPVWAIALGVSLYKHTLNREGIKKAWSQGVEDAFYQSVLASKVKMPEMPADSHFTKADIAKIGRSLVGLRHVSTRQAANRELEKGMNQGCSLNLSFCQGESGEAKFQDLDLKVEEEAAQPLIEAYDKAVTDFIRESILMDIQKKGCTLRNILEALDETSFMLVKTHYTRASDVHSYHGLGRWAKESVEPSDLTLLRPLKKEDLSFSSKEMDRDLNPKGIEEVLNYLAASYRQVLVHHLRSNSFRASEYRQSESALQLKTHHQ